MMNCMYNAKTICAPPKPIRALLEEHPITEPHEQLLETNKTLRILEQYG
eukprot:CAMPEP_0197624560 /NCGR_PEP_ID=MMETSP1338-20131121/4146_1 /TAXON_ID=43686 ORGANISM="Pelagodinium beii, Strain RCC1491" /NCGR_SAMPLE_ID=MMETSP1338 /ASSEMBLY_ACC=CAM_ASM_000754 /LENGTH=48 /DNA_ID= /DNA_START= /DNA_END= /DNA_ORIENTATION=